MQALTLALSLLLCFHSGCSLDLSSNGTCLSETDPASLVQYASVGGSARKPAKRGHVKRCQHDPDCPWGFKCRHSRNSKVGKCLKQREKTTMTMTTSTPAPSPGPPGPVPGPSACTPAVIVLRHFVDIDGDSSNYMQGPFCYKMPIGSAVGETVQIPWRRLQAQGIQASVNYATALPGFMAHRGLCPISRVYTINPGSKDATQNPFDSLYPFIFNQQITDINFLSENELLDLNPMGLLPGGGLSTVICWTKQTLWGTSSFDDTQFLGKLRRGNQPSLQERPTKAPVQGADGLYVYTNFGMTDQKYDLTIAPTFTDLKNPPPGPARNPCS